MESRLEKTRAYLKSVKTSSQFRNFLTFLIFVVIALLFWLIMALNDNVQDSFDVSFRLTNVPDSVTFINDPPERIHVTVRDRGTRLLRIGHLQHPSVSVDFRNYSDDGRFRFTRSELLAAMKQTFGASATISSMSVDSLSLRYTTAPGRRVAIQVNYHVSAVSGKTVLPNPQLAVRSALVYGDAAQVDTIRFLRTERISLSNIKETQVVEAKIKSIPGVKVKPDKVKVTFVVEPLVKKESMVMVTADNVPSGQELLFFPAKVLVVYYVPMSLFNSDDTGIVVKASYPEAKAARGSKVGLRITHMAPHVRNVSLATDSVEYAIVRGQ